MTIENPRNHSKNKQEQPPVKAGLPDLQKVLEHAKLLKKNGFNPTEINIVVNPTGFRLSMDKPLTQQPIELIDEASDL